MKAGPAGGAPDGSVPAGTDVEVALSAGEEELGVETCDKSEFCDFRLSATGITMTTTTAIARPAPMRTLWPEEPVSTASRGACRTVAADWRSAAAPLRAAY